MLLTGVEPLSIGNPVVANRVGVGDLTLSGVILTLKGLFDIGTCDSTDIQLQCMHVQVEQHS